MDPFRAGLVAALGLALAACEARESSVVLPAFASQLPGRTAVVSWGPSPTPEPLAELLAATATQLGLQRVETGDVLAYRSPDEVVVGWSSLAASSGLRRALQWLPGGEADDGADLLYLDLQQLVECAGLQLPDRVRERTHHSEGALE